VLNAHGLKFIIHTIYLSLMLMSQLDTRHSQHGIIRKQFSQYVKQDDDDDCLLGCCIM
jgi:hypothetical protein